MTHTTSPLQMAQAIGVTLGLGAIGLISHSQTNNTGQIQDALNGSLQSAYEAGFDAANPLQDIAISTFGAVRWAVFGQGMKEVVVGADGWLFSSEEWAMSEDFDARLTQSVQKITKARDTLADQGIDLIVVAVPDKSEVYAHMLDIPVPAKVASRRDVFVTSLSTENIAVVDAYETLNIGASTTFTYQRDDTHWSPEGAQLVASEIAQLAQSMETELTSAEVTITETGTRPHDGDLLKFAETGVFRAWLGPEQSQIATFETEIITSGDLFSAAPIDVALVGTSFSAKPEWHFADFVQGALGAEAINYAQEGRGPFVPMQDMLASETFETTPPKLVIWEIPVRYTTLEISK
ncbi:MAG: hypothetical protein HRU30_18060 [Rhodobacteraceae bacterium]|nr:hypothetical protein [Paracoccaceae bacterium]